VDRLNTLVAAARFDICGCGRDTSAAKSPLGLIYHAALPGGGCIPLLKVLLTNFCVNDCAYCVNQIGRDIPRCSFQSEELSRLFMEMQGKNLVQGLFLSSGIGTDASRTMEAMIKVVEILRHRYGFRGYIHLKILPGARFDCVEAACRLASRVSINIEAPTVRHLARLSHKKDLQHGILERMSWVKEIISKNETLVPSGQTTQFVVGAAGETDLDILHATWELYKKNGLRRIYFSAFRPVSNSLLEGVKPASPLREHRLYQMDWLLRIYGFSPDEVGLALDSNGSLSLGKDPKLTIARKQPWLFPFDLNKAAYEELIRVPGIGPASAKRIVETRLGSSISSIQQLKKMGVATNRALPFIWFKGILDYEKQLSFISQVDKESQAPSPLPKAQISNSTLGILLGRPREG
jgi:putative DNA modification/repair radical SAM protein